MSPPSDRSIESIIYSAIRSREQNEIGLGLEMETTQSTAESIMEESESPRSPPQQRRLTALAIAPLEEEPTTFVEKLKGRFHKEPLMWPSATVSGNWAGAGSLKTPCAVDGGATPAFETRNKLELLWLPVDTESDDTPRLIEIAINDERGVRSGPGVSVGHGHLRSGAVYQAIANPGQDFPHRISLHNDTMDVAAGSVEISICFHPAPKKDVVRLGEETDDVIVVSVFAAAGLFNVQRKVIRSVSEINSPWPVIVAIPTVIVYIAIGVIFFMVYCEFEFIDAIYLTFVTFTTVGYGDHSGFGKFYDEEGNVDSTVAIFASIYMVSAVVIMGTALSIIAGFLETQLQGIIEKMNALKHIVVRERCSEHNQHHCRSDLSPAVADVMITCVSAVALLFSGAILFSAIEEVDLTTGIYFACATVTTVGFGDVSPSKPLTKWLSLAFLPLGTMIVAKALNDISGILDGIKQANIENVVIKQFGDGLDYSDFADLKNQVGSDAAVGEITKQEFLLAMLMRLGRLKDNDTKIIYQIYDHLDADGGGSIGIEDCKAGSVPHQILERHGLLYADDGSEHTVAPDGGNVESNGAIPAVIPALSSAPSSAASTAASSVGGSSAAAAPKASTKMAPTAARPRSAPNVAAARAAAPARLRSARGGTPASAERASTTAPPILVPPAAPAPAAKQAPVPLGLGSPLSAATGQHAGANVVSHAPAPVAPSEDAEHEII